MRLTDYEKKVLSLIYINGSLSKKDIARKGQMSWGTAVKTVNTRVEKDYLVRSGTSRGIKFDR